MYVHLKRSKIRKRIEKRRQTKRYKGERTRGHNFRHNAVLTEDGKVFSPSVSSPSASSSFFLSFLSFTEWPRHLTPINQLPAEVLYLLGAQTDPSSSRLLQTERFAQGKGKRLFASTNWFASPPKALFDFFLAKACLDSGQV